MLTPKQEKEVRTFLSRVVSWPEPGEEAYINFHTTWKPKDWKVGDRNPWSDRNSAFVQDIDTGINALYSLLSDPNVQDIYIALGTQWHTKPELDKNKQPTGRTVVHRSKENTLRNISFRIDVDIYKGYETEIKAQAAISKFCLDANLPEPSVMVHSGGGYHVYWVLDKPVANDKWQLVADTLNVATQELGLNVDTAVTVDRSRVLRIPHTFNCKTDKKRPVTPYILDGPTYTLDQIEQPLLKYRGVVKVTSNVTIDISELAGKQPAFGTVDDDLAALAAGYKHVQYDQIDLKDVYKECGFIGDALRTGGEKIDSNDQWHTLMLLAAFTKQGVKAAHAMSEKWPNYVADEVDKKFAEKQNYVASGVKWPKCSTIAKYNTEACKSCKHLAADKHPFNFTTTPSQPKTVLAVIDTSHEEIMPDPELFTRDTASGWWSAKAETKDHKEYWATVIKTWVGNAYMSLHGDAKMYVQILRNSGRFIDVEIPAEALSGNGETLAKILLKAGAVVSHNLKTKELFLSWMERLMKSRETQSEHAPYGWATDHDGKIIGFAFNKVLYKKGSTERVASGDPEIHQHYTTMGSLDEWKEAAKLVTDTKRPAIDAILAAQFAAPLIRFVGDNLFLNVYSPGSGAGKSTAMHVGQAVWGSPKAIHSLQDTEAALFITAGAVRHLPLNWDEVRGDVRGVNAKTRMNSIIFQLTGGNEKARATADIKLRKKGSWQTILVAASNETLEGSIIEATKGSEAGFMRVFELEAPILQKTNPGMLPLSDGDGISKVVDINYGKAGEKYAQWLGENYDTIAAQVKETQDRFEKKLHSPVEERFWLKVAVVLYLGAKYANQLDLTEIDEEAIFDAVAARIMRMREHRVSEPMNSTDPGNAALLVSRFLLEKRRFVIGTNKIRMTKNGPVGEIRPMLATGVGLSDYNRDTLVAQIGREDGRLRVLKAPFKEFIEKLGFNTTEILNTLAVHFGADINAKGQLGSGLGLSATAQQRVIDIQFNNYAEFEGLSEFDQNNVVPISKATGFNTP